MHGNKFSTLVDSGCFGFGVSLKKLISTICIGLFGWGDYGDYGHFCHRIKELNSVQ